jgi:hypothetical protein
MRSSAFRRSFFVPTSAMLLTFATVGCVSTVDGSGTGGSGGESSAGGETGTAGSDCGDTESTSIAVGVGVGGAGTSAVSGVGGSDTTVSATVSSSSVGAGGAGGQCGTPPPVGQLEFCGGAVSAGSGMGNSCATIACDGDGNTWDQTCDESGFCTCTYNNQPVCACQANPAGVCSGGGGCCPAPWWS